MQFSGLILSVVIFPLSLVNTSQAQLIIPAGQVQPPPIPAGFTLQDARQQGRQLTIDTRKTIRKLPENFKTTRTPIIWLSCNPGGLEENNVLVIHSPILIHLSEVLLTEKAIWHDTRSPLELKQIPIKGFSEYFSKHSRKLGDQSISPHITQATQWIRTKDNKMKLIYGGVRPLPSSQTSSRPCRKK
ncbi:hypothetical protein [Acaryochloris marina]|uniref:Uncharacterized protein n=1 Tax=Acaryochloris marina (strain MBIC 11017) TaxID=329726 RepID=B0CE65_ACAM1|nr:hypothetical protein [Acaryochloris marina]ABW25699.1 hypothetical protein AM1_0650 [Acaryochloris marina MBIC11017]